MNLFLNKKILITSFVLGCLTISSFVLAEENLDRDCQMEIIEQKCQALDKTQCRQLLEKCEAYYQEQSTRVSADINKTASEKKTLQNKISGLTKQIKSLEYQIAQSSLVIKDLKVQLEDTTGSIDKTSLKIEDSKDKLANILRTINNKNQEPLIEVLFSEAELSGFFNDLSELEILDSKNKDLLKDIKVLKSNLEQQKNSLDEEKDGLENMVKINNLQKQENSKLKKDQEYNLNLTEKEYQKQLKEREEIAKKAATIRARIFELIGVPQAPTFGQAYAIAKYAASATGIRPAFLLAILQQESSIGKNVGQCFLSDPTTGAGKKVNTGATVKNVMKPTRDVPHFLSITKELGRDCYSTPVSCPMSFGYGGAMGPAQFIPSTWVLFKGRITGVTGKAADPWNISDAFLAAAFYLADSGAGAKTEYAEKRAALTYFSGSPTNTSYNFYANSVLSIARGFEADIAVLESNQ